MNPKFINAVKSGDVYTVRSYITSEIIEDPTFGGTDLDKCIQYVKKSGLGIFEEYRENVSETKVPEDPSQWDTDLFYNKVEDLLHNFAYDQRIEQIKAIGRRVYQTDSENRPSFKEAPKSHRSLKKVWLPISLGIMVLVIVVAVIASK